MLMYGKVFWWIYVAVLLDVLFQLNYLKGMQTVILPNTWPLNLGNLDRLPMGN